MQTRGGPYRGVIRRHGTVCAAEVARRLRGGLELNAYCDNAQAGFKLYSAMHRDILDVFNEDGVQIMTPAY
jgi:hypothetical protein